MKDLKFIVRNGVTETVLTHSPDGWGDTMLEIDRSPKFLGIVRSFTVQLKFVLEGAQLLRSIFYNRLQNETFITIQKLDPITLVYADIYTGQFDFSTFYDSEYNVAIKVTDLSLSTMIKKNIDTTYTTTYPYTENTIFYTYGNPIEFTEPMQGVKFSTFFGYLFDRITDGRYSSGEFGLDLSELIAGESLITTLMANAPGLIGARMDRVETSFADLLKNIFILFDLVMVLDIVGGKETLKLTSTANAFPETVFCGIENPNEIKVSVAKEYVFDTVKVGHPEQDYNEDQDASLEIGTSSIFSNTSDFVASQEMDLQTTFRADTIGINQYIAQYGVAFETADYTTFLVHVTMGILDAEGKFILYKGFSEAVNPPTSYTQFNIGVSPKRLYKLHERFVNSCYFGGSDTTSLLSGKLNILTLYTATAAGEEAIEFEGLGITRVLTPYFIPLYIEITGTLPANIDLASFYNPVNSLLSFEYRGETYTGYVINIKSNIYGKNKSTIKLLCSATNDLTKLIH